MVAKKPFLYCVEDHDGVRAMYQQILDYFGYETCCFADGKQAWEAYHQNGRRPELILSDVQMPHMDGLELAERVWQHDQRMGREATPILLCTTDTRLGTQVASNVRAVIEKGDVTGQGLADLIEQHRRQPLDRRAQHS